MYNPGNRVKYDSIDEVIIRLLGLKSGGELDYNTYFRIIRNKLATAKLSGKDLVHEEDELLRKELRRVQNLRVSGGRFKIRKKRAKVTRTAPPSGTTSNKRSFGGSLVRSPREMLSPNDINPAESEDDSKDKKLKILTSIQKTLDSIIEILLSQTNFAQKMSEQERRDREAQRRGRRESALEGGLGRGIGALGDVAKKMMAPFGNIIEKIKRFLFFVLLGRAFNSFMNWLNDKENRKKFNYLVDFFVNHWPAIAGLYILFGTSFGKLVRGLLKGTARMIVALAVSIPKLIRFLRKNKKFAFLAVSAAPLVSREVSKLFDSKEKPDSENADEKSSDLTEVKTEVEKAKDIEIESSPNKPNVGGLVPGVSTAAESKNMPALNRGGVINKISAFKLGGLISKFYSGGIKTNNSSKMNVYSGIPITGAGKDDTLIAAKTGEAILTEKDQKDIKKNYVHRETKKPLDIPKYLSGRKPGKVNADKIRFAGGFFQGGVISKFHEGGMVGDSYGHKQSDKNEGKEMSFENKNYPIIQNKMESYPSSESTRYTTNLSQSRNRNSNNIKITPPKMRPSIPKFQQGGLIGKIGGMGENIFNIITGRKSKEPEKSKDKKKKYDSPLLNNRSRMIFNRLVNGGMSRVAAGGILANIGVETGYTYDPNQHQDGGGPGRGLVQWEKGGRFDTDRINLVDFANTRKKSWNDLNTQVDFILHELKEHPEYKPVRVKLNAQKDIKDATKIFLVEYEKAGAPHTEQRFKVADEIIKEGYLIPTPPTKPKPKEKGFFENLGFPKFEKGGEVTNEKLNRGLTRLNHNGHVRENSGIDYGYGADRQLVLVKPGEFVLPTNTVNKIGINNLNKLISTTDSNASVKDKSMNFNLNNTANSTLMQNKFNTSNTTGSSIASNNMFNTNKIEKMQKGGVVENQFVKKGSIISNILNSNSTDSKTDTDSQYIKNFLPINFNNPEDLSADYSESSTTNIANYLTNKTNKTPEITPYTINNKTITSLPPLDLSKNIPMNGVMGRNGGGSEVPSFSAASPINDRDLNAKMYYGIS